MVMSIVWAGMLALSIFSALMRGRLGVLTPQWKEPPPQLHCVFHSPEHFAFGVDLQRSWNGPV